MILKSVIRYAPTNSVEATWVDRIVTPAQGTEGEEGYVPESVTEVQVRCHSYDQTQMDMLTADLGSDAPTYASLIQEVQDNFIPPPPVVIQIPQSVSPRQIRQALTRFNLRNEVEAAIAAADQDTQDWYKYATEFRRDHPAVAALAAALNVTEQNLDDLWTLAYSL